MAVRGGCGCAVSKIIRLHDKNALSYERLLETKSTGETCIDEAFPTSEKSKMVSNKKDFLGEIPASTMETTKEKKANADIEGEDECVQVLDSFSQNTTAHGFKYAASKERNKFVRCLWCFAIAVATFTLIWTLLTNKAKLEKYPTRTVVDVKYVKELPFPAVTICNLNEFDYRKADNLTNVVNGAQKVFNLYLAGTFLAHTDLETYLKDPEYEDVLNVAIDEVYHEVFPQINETFLHCEWKGVTHSCESIFRPVYTFDGMCYQFNGNASNPLVTSAVGPMNGLTVVMDINQAGYVVESMLSAGGKVLLHEPGTFPAIVSGSYLVPPGFTTSSKITYDHVSHMPYPFKSYGDEYCTKDVHVDEGHVYNRDSCLATCLLNTVLARCNCSITYGDVSEGVHDDVHQCTFRDLLACIRPALTNTFSDVAFSHHSCSRCKYSCDVTTFSATSSHAMFPSNKATELLRENGRFRRESDPRSTLLELSVYYDQLVKNVVRYEAEYTWDSILGSIGGQMGLFMGASLLTLCEIMECLCFALLAFAKKCYRKMHKSKKDATEVESTKAEQDWKERYRFD